MSRIKKLNTKDYDNLVSIVADAYPGFGIVTDKDKNKFKKKLMKLAKDPTVHPYGYFKQGKLMGCMVLYDFIMNFLSIKVKIGGVGLVAVDLLHKKEKICKEMIFYFLEQYRKKNACLVALYPFRPDFYKRMGFGYGTKMNQYRIRPTYLPRGECRKHIIFLKRTDKKMLNECYHRFFMKNHGMLDRKYLEWDLLFDRPGNKIVGYREGNTILGYLVFSFKRSKEDNWLDNNILIREFIYEKREVLSELLTFLYTQLDQVKSIILSTQDEDFHVVPSDPRNGSGDLIEPCNHVTNKQGIGIMYRAIDTEGLFRLLSAHNFGNQSCKLKLTILDSFLKENDGSTIIHFRNGRPHLIKYGDYDVEISLDVSDFSSLIMGTVAFKSLYKYGLADISSARYIDTVNKLFTTEQKPMCTTVF